MTQSPGLTAWRHVVDAAELPDPPELARFLRAAFPLLSGKAIKRAILEGKVWVDEAASTIPNLRIRVGQTVELKPSSPRLDRRRPDEPTIYYLDPFVVVADKPDGLLTLPFAEERDALATRLRDTIARREHKRGGGLPPLCAVHRLDKLASGLVVLARSVVAQRELKRQFAEHSAERIYLARVMGTVAFDEVTRRSTLAADRGDGLKGSVAAGAPGGQEAITHFAVVERGTRTTLLRCRLETGRTHQIRIHAAEMGHPVVGEPVYIRDHKGPWVNSRRLLLHAAHLGFRHPRGGEALAFDSPVPPEVMCEVLARGPSPSQRSRREGQGGSTGAEDGHS
ncbi:MAG: RluA family pseudouridine synthase [Candidatus Schekmanbacteria bacterium]|nr:RluA family pseudouridine synthase [Candidatus Schekmanbacteria bacterium]